VTPFYFAGACLVVAQILGIYALITRKADFTFVLIMGILVVVALASGAEGVYRQLH
jgi:glucose uptake protein GlcU